MRRRKGHWKWSRKMCTFESLWCYIINVWFCVSYSTPLVFCVFLVEMKVIIDLTEHQIRLYNRTIFLKWGSVKICPMCYEPWTSNSQPHVCRVLCARQWRVEHRKKKSSSIVDFPRRQTLEMILRIQRRKGCGEMLGWPLPKIYCVKTIISQEDTGFSLLWNCLIAELMSWNLEICNFGTFWVWSLFFCGSISGYLLRVWWN